MDQPSPQHITQLLLAWREGNKAALDELMPLVYDELRRLAKNFMRRQNPGHTLETTALVNEAYLRLIDSEPLLSPAMLRLAGWMSEHYLCPLGQVLQAIVPAGVRGQAGTREMSFLSVTEAVRAQLAAGAHDTGR